MPDTLAYVDLSHNNLREVPDCLYRHFEHRVATRRGVSIQLKGNDMWFMCYTALPPTMVSPATVSELVRAHRMSLVSTLRLQQAIDILRHDRRHAFAAADLESVVAKQVLGKVDEGGCSWDNDENVHGSGVQSSTLQAVRRVMALDAPSVSPEDPAQLAAAYARAMSAAAPKLQAAMTRHFADDGTYRLLAKKVLDVALAHPYRDALLRILLSEIQDGLCTCRAGRMSRLLNSLNGFVDGVGVGLSKNEEVANTILVIRNRNALVYRHDMDAYLAETIPAALQALEDACVPQTEHAAWLESV
jgi:hypothetical protein